MASGVLVAATAVAVGDEFVAGATKVAVGGSVVARVASGVAVGAGETVWVFAVGVNGVDVGSENGVGLSVGMKVWEIVGLGSGC